MSALALLVETLPISFLSFFRKVSQHDGRIIRFPFGRPCKAKRVSIEICFSNALPCRIFTFKLRKSSSPLLRSFLFDTTATVAVKNVDPLAHYPQLLDSRIHPLRFPFCTYYYVSFVTLARDSALTHRLREVFILSYGFVRENLSTYIVFPMPFLPPLRFRMTLSD